MRISGKLAHLRKDERSQRRRKLGDPHREREMIHLAEGLTWDETGIHLNRGSKLGVLHPKRPQKSLQKNLPKGQRMSRNPVPVLGRVLLPGSAQATLQMHQ